MSVFFYIRHTPSKCPIANCSFRDLFRHHWLPSRRREFDRTGDHTDASARDRHTRPSHLGPAAAALLNIHKRVIVDAAAYAFSVYYAFLIGFSLVSASSPPPSHVFMYFVEMITVALYTLIKMHTEWYMNVNHDIVTVAPRTRKIYWRTNGYRRLSIPTSLLVFPRTKTFIFKNIIHPALNTYSYWLRSIQFTIKIASVQNYFFKLSTFIHDFRLHRIDMRFRDPHTHVDKKKNLSKRLIWIKYIIPRFFC